MVVLKKGGKIPYGGGHNVEYALLVKGTLGGKGVQINGHLTEEGYMLDFIGDFISGIIEPWITKSVQKIVSKFRKK